MNQTKKEQKVQIKKELKQIKRRKKNALVVCRDGQEYWTTQNQFWQWVRERVIIKAGDNPLRGKFLRENEEKDVVICNTVLNLGCPNHLHEALYSRRFRARI
jgi:hypothetical protein